MKLGHCNSLNTPIQISAPMPPSKEEQQSGETVCGNTELKFCLHSRQTFYHSRQMVDICVIMEISLKMHLARWIKRERHYVSFSLGFSWNTEVRNGVKVEVEMGVGSVRFFSSSVVIWKKKKTVEAWNRKCQIYGQIFWTHYSSNCAKIDPTYCRLKVYTALSKAFSKLSFLSFFFFTFPP